MVFSGDVAVPALRVMTARRTTGDFWDLPLIKRVAARHRSAAEAAVLKRLNFWSGGEANVLGPAVVAAGFMPCHDAVARTFVGAGLTNASPTVTSKSQQATEAAAAESKTEGAARFFAMAYPFQDETDLQSPCLREPKQHA